MMQNEMFFRFGVMSPKFSEQCKEQGYEVKNAEKWDRLVDCTVELYIHNILTDSRYDECLKRILKKYKKDLIKTGDDEE